MKRYLYLVCLLAALSGITESYAQKGFRFGVDFNGGMTLEDKWFQLNKPAISSIPISFWDSEWAWGTSARSPKTKQLNQGQGLIPNTLIKTGICSNSFFVKR